MSELPELLVEAIGDSRIVTRVDLGGGDAVVVTPGATHVYRSDGLLSDETVDSYGHEITLLALESGRRKATLRLVETDRERSFKIPSSAADEIVEAILEGVLRTADVVDDDETIENIFQFSELTFVVTDRRLLKHVGGAVWDAEFETVPYETLVDLDFEEGSVATQVVVETDDRRERVKVPNEYAARVRNAVRNAVFAFHDVSSFDDFRAAVGADEPDDAPDEAVDADAIDDGFIPAQSSPADQGVGDSQGAVRTEVDATVGGPRNADIETETKTRTETETDSADLAAEVAELNERLDRQADLLESQQATIEQLVEELRRGR